MASTQNSNQVNTRSSPPLPDLDAGNLSYLFRKTVLDYLIIIPSLLLLAPLFVLFALLIRLDSAGSIFARQVMLGRNGREFTAYRFRIFHSATDPRPTRTGVLLRRYGLEELPLLLNVLKREMSLIGPRPASPLEWLPNSQYRASILQAYPGLTGLWQINQGRDNRLQQDLAYVRKWTIWLDVKILFLTVPAVLRNGD